MRILGAEVKIVKQKKPRSRKEDLRLSPEKRLCPKFDAQSLARFPVAGEEEMGVSVVDNCAEEHMM